jgi:hypothetical protein
MQLLCNVLTHVSGFGVTGFVGEARCKSRGNHCKWASYTKFDGTEAANGIKVLGRVSGDDLNHLLQSARVFAVPIVKSTGINTKCLLALESNIPMVLTSTAAVGIKLDNNSTELLTVSDTNGESFSAAIQSL